MGGYPRATNDRLAVAPFRQECKIPHTAPLTPLDEQPPLAPNTPMPNTFLDILEPWAAKQMVAHWNQLQRWHAHGGSRPRARAWGHDAIKRQCQGRTFDLRGGPGRTKLLAMRGTAIPPIINTVAVANYFADFPHRRLLDMLVNGVRFQADLPLHHVMALNLSTRCTR